MKSCRASSSGGEIAAAKSGIFAEIAQDVGELEGDAAVGGEGEGFFAAVEAPDVEAGDADDAGDAVAVAVRDRRRSGWA